MLNKEKYEKEILDIACHGFNIALVGDKVVSCKPSRCTECAFRTAIICSFAVEKWANREYVEPPVDWSKVAVDTPILVRDSEEEAWRKRHFAKYENGIVYAWSAGSTSWSASASSNIAGWKMAKLAESEEK